MSERGDVTICDGTRPAGDLEGAAETTGLDALFAPRSIALVGASDDAARIGGRPLRYLRASGYQGRVYPVNPRRETVQGEQAWPAIAALPEVATTASLAFIAAVSVNSSRW